MKTTAAYFCFSVLVVFGCLGANHPDDDKQPDKITTELNAYWSEVSRSVREGDFKGYSATCHPQGVLVSGGKRTSYPLSQALAKWKQGFEDTRTKQITASVEFRISQRFHDATTAHETGIFRYASTKDGKETVAYIHFEGLLIKTPTGWQIMMEYQKSKATAAEWKALASMPASAKTE